MLFNAGGIDVPKEFEGPAERKSIKIREGDSPDYGVLAGLLVQSSKEL